MHPNNLCTRLVATHSTWRVLYLWDISRNDRPLMSQKIDTVNGVHSSPFRDGIVALNGAFWFTTSGRNHAEFEDRNCESCGAVLVTLHEPRLLQPPRGSGVEPTASYIKPGLRSWSAPYSLESF
ncbi:hypothetical protein V1509DRAFT_621750 [Lipomyces kononenkoae]